MVSFRGAVGDVAKRVVSLRGGVKRRRGNLPHFYSTSLIIFAPPLRLLGRLLRRTSPPRNDSVLTHRAGKGMSRKVTLVIVGL